ncbi:MAG: hypothetical protein RRA35_11620 [Desulfomonilia bacterium]|nr:hypothetical protein [Desulfomonilia bacterium]
MNLNAVDKVEILTLQDNYIDITAMDNSAVITNDLKEMDPTYVIPTHCTGRKAIMHMEQVMPEQFILNMSGTKLTFAA